MKRFLILCFAIAGLWSSSLANPVDIDAAKAVAAKFMGTEDLFFVSTYQTNKNVAAFYVFNTSDGYVIVSADDCETPIIGYSHESRFDPNNVPLQMDGYLQNFVARIEYCIENQIDADEFTIRQWNLVKVTGRLNNQKDAQSIGPLLTDKWHQGCLYNSLCPTMSGPCDHARVGCMAVAMGQIMHYWKYPATGWGSHSYTNGGTTLSSDFGHTSYDWDHMPDSLTENSTDAEIEAVATLLYHCGVSVNMYYTLTSSVAESDNAPNALYRYFDYSRLSHKEKRSDHSDDEWLSLLKHDLDLQRPVLYLGGNEQGGHAFVCDGYDENNLLHFNWGWGTANGYFALGNLNPNGYAFNNNNYAIIDIIPHYDPCVVVATAQPAAAGTIEGIGEYHIGEQCTLTAIPSENYKLYCWEKDGQTLSNATSYTLGINDDTINIEAHFSLFTVSEITASYPSEADSMSISLSWNYENTDWPLLKQFEVKGEVGGLATDNEHIYITYASWNNPSTSFEKYSMDGILEDSFNINSLNNAFCLAYDGTDFYCNCLSSKSLLVLYRIDLDNKTVIDSTEMGSWFESLTYDPEYDGFWLGQDYRTALYDRQGRRLKTSPSTPDYLVGSGYYTDKDGSPHLLLARVSGVFDYDINSNTILDCPLLTPNGADTLGFGACTGKYDGKDAMIIVINNTVCIYEIKGTLASTLEQIIGYRLYRADSEGHTVMIADEMVGSSYLDTTWGNVPSGMYRFGISMVFANGSESETIWSNFVEKTDYGIGENHDDSENPSVHKVFEDGQIIITKDGKRYTVTGQQLN